MHELGHNRTNDEIKETVWILIVGWVQQIARFW
jgi:hypothetical protein